MNILFIHPVMFHPHRGGIERVSDLLIREFIKRGHHVLSLHNVRDENRLGYLYPALPYFFPYSINETEKNGTFYQNFLKEHRIEIIINQDPQSYHELCRFSKELPGVYTISVIHQYPLGIYNHLFELLMWRKGQNTVVGKVRKIFRFLKYPMIKLEFIQTLKREYENIFSNTDLLCLLSLKFIPDLKRIYSKSTDRVIAIPNPNTYPPQLETNIQKKKQLLYVGRIEWYQKRVGRLIDIWGRIYKDFPDWELVIVGDGPNRQELESQFLNLEHVIFTGWQDPESYYRSASILCMTSDYEGWGMVLTEAMTFGTIPVLFNSFASVTDIIEDGQNGILVPPFSCKQFAWKLGALMKDETLRAEMSVKCMESVKQFDIQYVADKWEEVFNSLKKKLVFS
ncbi:glycosyltransferase [Bacteroides sp.]|uniref:glycosyltransferase n=1 Tax=Bacteroides sp. TaxID=29523 RepID=UPI00260C8C3E|nr:glycosyltransferase [Bacteroides sp.]